MNYIIISNIAWAIALILLYSKYSKFKKSALSDARRLRRKADHEIEERKDFEEKLLEDLKSDDKRLDNLLRELSALKKEVEMEMKLRLEAEKSFSVASQRNEDLEKKIEELSGVKNSTIDESKDFLRKTGEELYKKFNENYKSGIAANKNLISDVVKGITENIEKAVAKSVFEAQQKMIFERKNISSNKSSPVNISDAIEDPAKELVADLLYLIRASGYILNIDYFSASDFVNDEDAKLFLCEVAFVRGDNLYLFDFKACYYFAEYNQMKKHDHDLAAESLKQKLEKYISYISSNRYRESILKVVPSVKAKKIITVFAVATTTDLQILKDVQYYDKALKSNLEVMDFESINNLIL